MATNYGNMFGTSLDEINERSRQQNAKVIQQLSQAAQRGPTPMLSGGIAALGGMLGQAGVNYLAGDGLSPAQLKAQQGEDLTQELSGLQVDNPEYLKKLANAYQSMGKPKEALSVLSMIQAQEAAKVAAAAARTKALRAGITNQTVYDAQGNSSVIQLLNGKPFINNQVLEWEDTNFSPKLYAFNELQTQNLANAKEEIKSSENLLGQVKASGTGAKFWNGAKEEDLAPLGVEITRIANELRDRYLASQGSLPRPQQFTADTPKPNMFTRQAINLMNDAGWFANQMDGNTYQHKVNPYSVPELMALKQDSQTKNASRGVYREGSQVLKSPTENRFINLNEGNEIFNGVISGNIQPETYVNDQINQGTLAPENQGRLISGLSWMSQNPEISSLLVQQDKHPTKGGRWLTEWKEHLSALEKAARDGGSTAESFAPYWAALDAEELINTNKNATGQAKEAENKSFNKALARQKADKTKNLKELERQRLANIAAFKAAAQEAKQRKEDSKNTSLFQTFSDAWNYTPNQRGK